MSHASLNALKCSCCPLKFKFPLRKTQSFCPCSRALNRSSQGLNILIQMTGCHIIMANIYSTEFQYIAAFEEITKAQLNFVIFAISIIFYRQLLEYFYAA